ncbi:MAG: hypothetical protein ACKO34_08350 [Vampirovibrionales bacterium]
MLNTHTTVLPHKHQNNTYVALRQGKVAPTTFYDVVTNKIYGTGAKYVNPLTKDDLVVFGDTHGITKYLSQGFEALNLFQSENINANHHPTVVALGDHITDKHGIDAVYTNNPDGNHTLSGGNLHQLTQWLAHNPNQFHYLMGNHEFVGLLLLLTHAPIQKKDTTLAKLQQALNWPDLEKTTEVSQPFRGNHPSKGYASLIHSEGFQNESFLPPLKQDFLNLVNQTKLLFYHEPTKSIVSHNVLTKENLKRYLQAFGLAPVSVWERLKEVRHLGTNDITPTLRDKVGYVLNFPKQWSKLRFFRHPKKTIEQINQHWGQFTNKLESQQGLSSDSLEKAQELRTLRLLTQASLDSKYFDSVLKQRPYITYQNYTHSELPSNHYLRAKAWPWGSHPAVNAMIHGHTGHAHAWPLARGSWWQALLKQEPKPLLKVGLNTPQASAQAETLPVFPVAVIQTQPIQTTAS